jgi:hypothetical protein
LENLKKVFSELLSTKSKETDSELSWYKGEKTVAIFSDKIRQQKKNTQENHEFLAKIDRNFINITKHSFDADGDHFSYKRAQFNFEKKHLLRSLMQEYVRPDDLEQSIVAGGFFSKYVADSPLSLRFPHLFELVSQNGDIDIFILNGSSDEYNAWFAQRNIQVHSEYSRDHYCNGYTNFENFKITTPANQTLNFVFLSTHMNTQPFDSVSVFDMDFSRIFYSYKFDALYVYVSLFEKTRRIALIHGIDLQLNDLQKYKSILRAEKSKFERQGYEMFRANAFEDNRDFSTLLTSQLVYFCKYCFKGYSSWTDQAEIDEFAELIDYFYSRFGPVIEYKLKSSQVEYSQVTALINKCLKNYFG